MTGNDPEWLFLFLAWLEGLALHFSETHGLAFCGHHLTGWDGGYAGTILRNFLKSIGIENYVNFHTLRACFATHVLASGAEPTQVMKMGGWSDFKTFQIYVRMAGVDVKGVTDNFRVMPRVFEDENVLKIR